MRKFTIMATGIAALASTAVATPAAATVYEYAMTNGDTLTIDTDNGTGTWVGNNIDVTFTSDQFGALTGDDTPSFTAILTSLDGTRLVNGDVLTDNPKNIDTTHPQVLKGLGNGKINLWAWWGDPIKAGDYVKLIGSVTAVPAPGMLALFGLALGLIGFGRRRKRAAVA